jgi:dCMP deaminase
MSNDRQLQKDLTYLRMAHEQAQLSKDPRHRVGCVILDADGGTLSAGYNGYAPGVPDTGEHLSIEEYRLHLTLHAELNALLRAQGRAAGGTLYVTKFPCPQCAAAIISSKVRRVVLPAGAEQSLAEDWEARVLLTKWQFEHGGVVLEEVW